MTCRYVYILISVVQTSSLCDEFFKLGFLCNKIWSNNSSLNCLELQTSTFVTRMNLEPTILELIAFLLIRLQSVKVLESKKNNQIQVQSFSLLCT